MGHTHHSNAAIHSMTNRQVLGTAGICKAGPTEGSTMNISP